MFTLVSTAVVAESQALLSDSSSKQLIVPENVGSPKSNQRTGDNFQDCDGCPELVVVPAGESMMGSPSLEAGLDNNEGPQHRVTITKPYAIGIYEVTWDEWRDGSGPENSRGDQGWGKGKRPVGEISWNDTQDYLRWLSKKTCKHYASHTLC